MDLLRCKNGHFYDGDKHEDCPHCKEEKKENRDAVTSKDDFIMFDLDINGKKEIPPVFIINDEKDKANENTMKKNNDLFSIGWNEENKEALSREKIDGAMCLEKNHAEDSDITIGCFGKQEPVVGWVVCISGEHYGEAFQLKSGMNYIGRLPSMDIVLTKDRNVSREKHMTIIYDPVQVKYVAYMGESKALAYVNEEMLLSPIELKAYDKISVGKSQLMFIPLCGEYFSWEKYKKIIPLPQGANREALL